VVVLSWGKATRKRASNTVVNPVPLVVGLANVDAATLWKKKKRTLDQEYRI
jgi:hypothetical protein